MQASGARGGCGHSTTLPSGIGIEERAFTSLLDIELIQLGAPLLTRGVSFFAASICMDRSPMFTGQQGNPHPGFAGSVQVAVLRAAGP
jgi:hypothetical protein